MTALDRNTFREKLMAIMPGYEWTVHRALSKSQKSLIATGIQSSGFNRLSTVEVSCSQEDPDRPWFTVKSAGYGRRALWLHKNGDITLARAFRGLQDYYLQQASVYEAHAQSLAKGRAS